MNKDEEKKKFVGMIADAAAKRERQKKVLAPIIIVMAVDGYVLLFVVDRRLAQRRLLIQWSGNVERKLF